MLCLWPVAAAETTNLPEGTDRWFFEGVVETVPSALEEWLQSGWRLEGSFLFTAIAQELAYESKDGREGRLLGGIQSAELEISEYYQPRMRARMDEGPVGFDYLDNDPAAGGRDWMGWFFPLRPSDGPGEGDWKPDWLQVWLFDSEGKLLRRRPPVLSPYGLAWETAWFRLRMKNEEGESADLEGPLRVFDPSLGGSLPSEKERLRAAVDDLAERLRDRDRLLQRRTDELIDLRQRLRRLREMVDLLVQKRAQLEKENARLEGQLEKIDPRDREALAALEAEKALLEADLKTMLAEKDALEDRLAQAETRILRQVDRIGKLEARRAAAPEDSPSVTRVPGRTLAVAEFPMIIEKPFIVEKRALLEPDESEIEKKESSEGSSPAPSEKPRRRSLRPLKFR